MTFRLWIKLNSAVQLRKKETRKARQILIHFFFPAFSGKPHRVERKSKSGEKIKE